MAPVVALIGFVAQEDPERSSSPFPWLPDGVSVDGTWTADLVGVASGGVERGFHAPRVATLGLELDLDALAGWSGVTARVEGMDLAGRGLTEDVGDVQVVSNLEGEDLDPYLSAAWVAGDVGAFTWLVGKLDANERYAASRSGGDFVQSSSGFSPTIERLPTFPHPAYSANVGWSFGGGTRVDVGLFDGRGDTAERGAADFLRGDTPLFWIAELAHEREGWRVAAGAWLHSGDAPRLDGSGVEDDSRGVYATADARLVEGLDAFVQVGLSDPDVVELERHLGLGLVRAFDGLAPGDESVGLGVHRVDASPDATLARGAETAIELYYRADVTPHLFVQPVAIVVLDPAADAEADDALVVGVRVGASF